MDVRNASVGGNFFQDYMQTSTPALLEHFQDSWGMCMCPPAGLSTRQ
jgi:hypothetical protein